METLDRDHFYPTLEAALQAIGAEAPSGAARRPVGTSVTTEMSEELTAARRRVLAKFAQRLMAGAGEQGPT